jgi:hypothetical protein
MKLPDRRELVETPASRTGRAFFEMLAAVLLFYLKAMPATFTTPVKAR